MFTVFNSNKQAPYKYTPITSRAFHNSFPVQLLPLFHHRPINKPKIS